MLRPVWARCGPRVVRAPVGRERGALELVRMVQRFDERANGEVRRSSGTEDVDLIGRTEMLRVLVVDGYDESRLACAKELRAAGYDVMLAVEEEEALEVLARSEIDFVLLDLPIDEAEETANAVKSTTRGQRATVIALVAPAGARRLRNGPRATTIDYFFLRPCPPSEIVKHLRRMRSRV